MDDIWRLVECCHAPVYFAPEARDVYASAGLKGFWMGYFASRAAALGPVSPQVVTAAFYNFAPSMVARAIPDAWRFCPPGEVLAARREVAGRCLRRLLGDLAGHDTVREAAGLARRAVEACPAAGRVLFAAHAAAPPPTEPPNEPPGDSAGEPAGELFGEPLDTLWHALTALREFRGDGHVAALVMAGVDGCEANVLASALGLVPPEQRAYRGWTEEEWAAAADRLRERGLLDRDGGVTERGRRERDAVEAATERLARAPMEALGEAGVARLGHLLRPLVTRIVDGGGVPFPNAMAMPRP